MKSKTLYIALALMVAAQTGCASYTPNTTVTLHVVDEKSNPIPGADMIMGFGQGAGAKGITDGNGLFVVSGSVGNASFGGSVQKDGFYKSEGLLWSGGWTNKESAAKTEGGYFPVPHPTGAVLLKPPSEFTITLKKILHPVPMYRKNVSISFPVQGEPIGFDLEAGDWVAPHGSGRRADFYLEATRRLENENDFDVTLSLTFPNDGDGLVTFKQKIAGPYFRSKMVGPQLAPVTGYDPGLTHEAFRRPDGRSRYTDSRDQHHVLRTRTKTDEEGKIIEAVYAKIEGDFNLSPSVRSDAPSVAFAYFFNPDPDPENRSLEWSGENLFLKGMNRQQLRQFDLELRDTVGRQLDRMYPQIPVEYRPRALVE